MRVHVLLGVCIAINADKVSGRHYNVETEAVKLYGEPLSSVIVRLRRTPEYLEILRDRLEELKKECEEYASHLLETHRLDLIMKLESKFKISTNSSMTMLRNTNWLRGGARMQNSVLRNSIRQVNIDRNSSSYLDEVVKELDNHPILHNVLSVAERNEFKNMGFELAGRYIHSLIRSMQPDDMEFPSTQQPWGDDNSTGIIKHDHSVTLSTPTTIYGNDDNSTMELHITKPSKYYRQKKVF